MKNNMIDHGRAFDWGCTSSDYARYRDIYPEAFYQKLLTKNIGTKGQKILDIGTGTGVIPRNMYRYGAAFTGVDIAENQIEQARNLAAAQNMEIMFLCAPAENAQFPGQTFDVVTACQCFPYFRHEELAKHLHTILKSDGRFAIMYMAWLPLEDRIAAKSEELILQYNPDWTGCNEVRRRIGIPDAYDAYFTLEEEELFDIAVPFTRDSWNGRIKACRGIGASLSEAEIEAFEKEHRSLLQEIAPEEFEILHYAAILVMRKKPGLD